MLDFF